MNGNRLDALARGLASDEISRRRALKLALGATLSSPVWTFAGDAAASVHCKPGHVACHGKCCRPGEHCVTPKPTGTGKHKKHHKPRCQCPSHRTSCPHGCFDLKTDPHNCGQCGHACGAGQTCSNGVCKSSVQCAAGQTNCGGTCVDLKSNVSNCGSCGHACPSGQVCSQGTCTSQCAAGETNCSGHCVDTDTDPANCGACGTTCAGESSGHACVAGQCRCNSLSDCTTGGTCGATACDNGFCAYPGGTACGTATCVGGMFQPAGFCGSGSQADPAGCNLPPAFTCGPAKCNTAGTDCDFSCTNCQAGANCFLGACCWPTGAQCDTSDRHSGSCCGAQVCNVVGSGTIGHCCIPALGFANPATCTTECCSGSCAPNGQCN